ncbi:hypothetical protein OAF54_02780 [bacterium]|nr:hypothetical protein [bacterium]
MKEAKERSILFSGEMVRAVLDGRKTQARRVIKPHPKRGIGKSGDEWVDMWDNRIKCPYGKPGDMLWCRETWATSLSLDDLSPSGISAPAYYAGYGGDNPLADLWYMADIHYRQWGSEITSLGKTRPSVHMPRWASRIQLEITDVRVERVQDISREDVETEGISIIDRVTGIFCEGYTPQDPFKNLWNSIYKKKEFRWDVNPWVWVVEFKVVT